MWLTPACPGRKTAANQSGQIGILAAAFSPVALMLVALAVDTGALAGQQRKLQGLADMAAIAAAFDLPNAEEAAMVTLEDNSFSATRKNPGEDSEEIDLERQNETVTVEVGRYVADPDKPFAERFKINGSPSNAVRVTVSETPERYFSLFERRHQRIDAVGIASVSSEVAFSVGSRLLSLDDGILNAVLSGLTGSEIELTVMDYRSLASADIDLFQTFEALATNADLTAATYDDVLDADVSLADFATAMADASDDTATVSALTGFARSSGVSALTLPLSVLFDLGPAGRAELGSPEPGLDLTADALQMLSAAAAVANGEHQVELDLGTDIPGLARLSVSLMIGERPQSSTWYSVSELGRSMVSTAQTRLFIEAAVEGVGLLDDDLLRLPIYLELAPASAEVAGIVCKSSTYDADRVDIDVTPGVLTLRIADLNGGVAASGAEQRFKPAKILSTGLINISATGGTDVVSATPETLRFHKRDIERREPKTARTRDALENALKSALRDLQIEVELGRLSILSPRVLQALVGDVLAAAVDPVDDVLFNLTAALGIGLGEADVWVHDARCNRSYLVQ